MLMQAEGNLAIYSNVFVNPNGGALTVRPHNAVPREVDVFFNTIVAQGRGLNISGGDPGFTQRARYNAIYGPRPLRAGDELGNVTGTASDAMTALSDPSGAPGDGLDTHPIGSALEATIDSTELPTVPEGALDFDGRARTGSYVGAYAGPADATSIPLELAARRPGT